MKSYISRKFPAATRITARMLAERSEEDTMQSIVYWLPYMTRRQLVLGGLAAMSAVRARGAVLPKAIVFDTFGTVVDWRGSIIAEGTEWGRAKGLDIDWGKFADRWRAGYGPSMDKVRKGQL